jgi:hypothetical protein
MTAGANVQFAPLFILYSISVAFFMPTIALVNSSPTMPWRRKAWIP